MTMRARFHYKLLVHDSVAIAVAIHCMRLPIQRDNFHRQNFHWRFLFHQYLKRAH